MSNSTQHSSHLKESSIQNVNSAAIEKMCPTLTTKETTGMFFKANRHAEAMPPLRFRPCPYNRVEQTEEAEIIPPPGGDTPYAGAQSSSSWQEKVVIHQVNSSFSKHDL